MPRFKSINFYQNKSKIKLALQKNKIFLVLGALLSDLQHGLWRSFRTPNTASPHVADFWLRVCY